MTLSSTRVYFSVNLFSNGLAHAIERLSKLSMVTAESYMSNVKNMKSKSGEHVSVIKPRPHRERETRMETHTSIRGPALVSDFRGGESAGRLDDKCTSVITAFAYPNLYLPLRPCSEGRGTDVTRPEHLCSNALSHIDCILQDEPS
jgi:hypothetical protein